jgi:hypothetical protein
MHNDGIHFYFARNAVNRWAEAARKFKSIWTRVPAQLWIAQPVTEATYSSQIRYNVILLADFLLERPFREYRMAPLILAQGGASLGFVWYGNEDFQWGDNVITKVRVGHFTMNWRAIPHNEKAYIVATDVFGTGYIGGEGMDFFDPHTYNPRASTLHKQGSIFCFMEPYKSLKNVREMDKDKFGIPNPHSVTGAWNPAIIGPLLSEDHKVDMRRPHHPSTFYYEELYKFKNLNPKGPSDDLAYGSPGVSHVGTQTWQGMQYYYNPSENQYTNIILNTGPWGPNVYNGCKLERIGIGSVLKDQGFEARYKPWA